MTVRLVSPRTTNRSVPISGGRSKRIAAGSGLIRDFAFDLIDGRANLLDHEAQVCLCRSKASEPTVEVRQIRP